VRKFNFFYWTLLFSGDILLKPIISSAGKDISHWFEKKSGDVSEIIISVCVHSYGTFLHRS